MTPLHKPSYNFLLMKLIAPCFHLSTALLWLSKEVHTVTTATQLLQEAFRLYFIACVERAVGEWEGPTPPILDPYPVPFVAGLHPFGTRQESLPQNMMWEVFKDRRWQKSTAVAKSAGIATTQAMALRWMWFEQINVANGWIWMKKIKSH